MRMFFFFWSGLFIGRSERKIIHSNRFSFTDLLESNQHLIGWQTFKCVLFLCDSIRFTVCFCLGWSIFVLKKTVWNHKLTKSPNVSVSDISNFGFVFVYRPQLNIFHDIYVYTHHSNETKRNESSMKMVDAVMFKNVLRLFSVDAKKCKVKWK